MVGKRLGTYRILGPLGAGGMGEVYLAEDTRLGRKVALKVLPEAFAADRERVTRLEQEARLLAALNHVNVATLFGLEEHEGSRFLVMELVDGESLAARIARGPLPLAEAVAIAEQIASALDAAHVGHIVHRDLKPANVMVTREGLVKVLDFGIATAFAPGGSASIADTPTVVAMTAADAVIGTVAYMSPEQARGESATPASDIWGVGTILHEMLTGTPPFDGENVLSTLKAVQHDAPAAKEQVRRVAPGRVSAILDKALAKNAGERQASMSVLRAELAAARKELEAPAGQDGASALAFLRRPPVLAAVVVVVAIAGWFVVSQLQQRAEQRWAREEGIPEIGRIAETFLSNGPSDDAWHAVELARRAEAALPGDPTLGELWPQIAVESETVLPEGLSLLARPYAATQVDWTPVEVLASGKLRMPLGYSRLKMVFEGREPVEGLTSGAIPSRVLQFYAERQAPEGMVLIPGRADNPNAFVSLTGLGEPRQAFEDFFMDRYEVTNREYKEFVDAGGYADPAYWDQPVMQGGRSLGPDEARALFVDQTGRPGPSTWTLGDYPEGQDNYPVSGLSWYEAAAYASFRGKRLPSIFHWDRAAEVRSALAVIPASNLKSDGPVAVGSIDAMNVYGTYDMAGNVREWVWNREASGSERFILGGAWSDPDYAFTDAFAQSPLDRSPLNGVRLMQYAGDEPRLAEIETALARPHRDFMAETPVDDATFALYRRQFDYDPGPLDAVIARSQEGDGWRWERVEFNAAYGGERMAAYIVMPTNAAPPFQAVIHFPGSGALYDNSAEDGLGSSFFSQFLVKTGRAYVLPIFKSTYDRQDNVKSDYPNETVEYRQHLIMWIQDFSRTIDYLETRADIDAERIAYYGTSWGGAFGAQIPAIERRIKAVVLVVAGMSFQTALPEADHINYVGRVTQPVLMINGQYDYFFPVETAQKPMFELLGTPPEDKKWQVYPGTHSAPRPEIVKETLAWLDRYLGPVK